MLNKNTFKAMGRWLVDAPYQIPVRSGLSSGLLIGVSDQLINRLPKDFQVLKLAEDAACLFAGLLITYKGMMRGEQKQAILFVTGASIAFLLAASLTNIQKLYQELSSADFGRSAIQVANRQIAYRPSLTYQQDKPVLALKK